MFEDLDLKMDAEAKPSVIPYTMWVTCTQTWTRLTNWVNCHSNCRVICRSGSAE